MNKTIEEIQEIIIEICKTEYEESSSEEYFIVKNAKEENVRRNLLDKLKEKNKDFGKMKYLDMAAYVLQVGDDVFINII